ncbi:hypothetical protein ONA91_24510 [Micromonospora sp. DR5-3]|uniref:WXG100 family type VII secretion target n=1 Tax=unclassified Micromonospora TaxID=2617518 RepID=UPI0011D99CEE|nr:MULTISPECIES: hypothetical protein [unclassified Micromonospora]MCW3817622.1 hypothetical protein [Micromonospora sp. DR5-3]TYC19620.1 hypothetical protein FXF52_35645 [Micromonospora sp. MP36]
MAEKQYGYVTQGITLPIAADEATITGMVMAFAQAQTEASDSYRNVTAAQGTLSAQWQSDAASGRFLEAVNQWLAGFQKVQHGLNMLNLNMEQYARLTTTTEDDNAMHAGSWATPASGEQPLPGQPLRRGMVVQKPFAPLGRIEGE